jgi:putative transposase
MPFEFFDRRSEYEIRAGSNLPHWFQSEVTCFFTFRTADSLPDAARRLWHQRQRDWLYRHGVSEVDALPPDLQEQFHRMFRREYHEALDRGYGECVLRRSELAKIVADSLKSHDGLRYDVSDFVVMPNHVHVLASPIGEATPEQISKSWKHFTAGKINKVLGRRGRFWQEESFDHLVRSLEQFEGLQRYIANNPIKAGLRSGEYILYQRPL